MMMMMMMDTCQSALAIEHSGSLHTGASDISLYQRVRNRPNSEVYKYMALRERSSLGKVSQTLSPRE